MKWILILVLSIILAVGAVFGAAQSASAAQPVTPSAYTVVRGDTLSAIARRFGMTLAALEALNPQIPNFNLIYPGQIIKLQSATSTPVPAPKPTPASVIYRIQTTQPVVFLTIDDGMTKDPNVAKVMQSNGLVASFFLTYSYIKDNPSYFANLSKSTGSIIEAHAYSHQNLINLSYSTQKADIERGLTSLTQTYGCRPTLFRPPYGNFNDSTRKAVGELGIKNIILWDVTVDNGKIDYAVGNTLRPGDIVLIHFRPTLVNDLQVFANQMKKQGFHTVLLENWL